MWGSRRLRSGARLAALRAGKLRKVSSGSATYNVAGGSAFGPNQSEPCKANSCHMFGEAPFGVGALPCGRRSTILPSRATPRDKFQGGSARHPLNANRPPKTGARGSHWDELRFCCQGRMKMCGVDSVQLGTGSARELRNRLRAGNTPGTLVERRRASGRAGGHKNAPEVRRGGRPIS